MAGTMGMTPEEENALIAEVRSHIGDEEYWDFDHPIRARVAPAVTVQLEIPGPRFRQLCRLAESQGMSVRQLLAEAIAGLDPCGEFEAEPRPRMPVGEAHAP